MGSFANSLHVKAAEPAKVAAAIREILAETLWREATGGTGVSPMQAGTANERGLQISAPQAGWVSVLDSDMAGAYELVWRLAERLEAPALFCYVNDSDSWGYLLADAAGETSEFDSEEEAEAVDDEADGDEDGGQLVDTAAALGQLNALMRDGSIVERMQDMQARMMEGAPAEIRQCEARLKSGRATAVDLQQYQAWAIREMPRHMADMKSLVGSLFNPGAAARAAAATTPGSGKPQPSAAKTTSAQWQQRLAALRPVLAGGTSDEEVLRVCQRQAVFAEEVLAEFLGLVGLPDFYAHLSYAYLDEVGPEELEAYKIQFIQHLRFEKRGVS